MILTRIPSTAIYTAPGSETLAFLLYNNASPPATLPLASTWMGEYVGYYLFLTTPPASVDPVALEKQIRAALPATSPTATGCLWALNDAKSFTMAAVLPITLNDKKKPAVAADTQIPSGVPPLGVSAGKVVVAANDNSSLLVSGITIALTGPLTRCLSFTGLWSLDPSDPNSALKNIVNVEVDPLAGHGSTTVAGFGPTLLLNSDPSGYFISDIDYGD